MILLFPDPETLKLALAGTIVGPDITLAPATLTIDTQGRLYVEPEADLSRATMKNLDRIGVKGCKRHGSKTPEKVWNWLQVVPLVKDPAEPHLASQTPVLFELESADDLPTLVSEMMRLGNDKQSFRWFEAEGSRVLLRVLGPPFYTLLRALDRTASGTKGTVRAYLEPTPRVWIEYGFTHPFASQLRVPEEQLLLLRAPRHWLTLDESPFQDVYDILQFDLPKAPVGWNESVAPEKIAVPLKLAAGNAADVPEVWVLRENALDQLDHFVRDADASLTQRLTFAVATDAQGKRLVVLRTRPSKLPPPVLPFENALGFKPFWKLPNLFLPAGKRLHPTLRRDAVRRLLADDPDQVVWLQPDSAGGFTPESVPDAAFRSLEDWVDYIIETNQEPLRSWIEATRFDFDSFVCVEPGSPSPKPPAAEEEVFEEFKPAKPAAPPRPTKAKPGPAPKAELAPPPEAKAPSAWRAVREGLEERFHEAGGPLDSPERRALWPKLAEANAGEGSPFEAAICWLNAMWVSEPACGFAIDWFRSEYPAGSLDAKEFDRRLSVRKPSVEDLRVVVAGFLWLSNQAPVPAWLPERLSAVQTFFETHEGSLPVRAVWLVSLRQAHLSGSDVLGLARARDRLLLRLLEEGLRAERDLPTFLRYDGLKDSTRLRLARDKALDLHQLLRRWSAEVAVNLPFIDLFFAFALARLGESAAAKELLEGVNGQLATSSKTAALAHAFFLPGFTHRIEQAALGKPHRGSFPPEIIEKIDEIRKLRAEHAAAAANANPVLRLATVKSDLASLDEKIKSDQSRLRKLTQVVQDFTRLGSRKPGKNAVIEPTTDEQKLLDEHAHLEGELPAMVRTRDALREEKSALERQPAGGKSKAGSDTQGNPYWESLCVIDRMRQESRVLEPNEVPDPYRAVRDTVRDDDRRHIELLHLTDVFDASELSLRIRRFYKQSLTSKTPKEWRCRVLHQALPLAPRVGEQFALEQLNLVPEALAPDGLVVGHPPTPGELAKLRGELIDRALVLAAQYGQTEYVQKLANQFADLIRTEPEDSRHIFINVAMGQCLRNLKKLGMREQIDRLLARVQSFVFPSGSVADLREKHLLKPDSWARMLQTLLHLAGGWLMLGQSSRANEVLDAARFELLTTPRKLLPKDFTDLAQAYIAALGHGPAESGIERIREFFEKVPASTIPNNWTGSQTYSRLHLKLIEEVIHAVTSDEFALGPAGRRWLDEDEYLVRNRIHADLKQLRERSGV